MATPATPMPPRPALETLPYPLARYARRVYEYWDTPQTSPALRAFATCELFELTLRYSVFAMVAEIWPQGGLAKEQQRTVLGYLYQPVLGNTLTCLRLLCKRQRASKPAGFATELAVRLSERTPNLLGLCDPVVNLRNRLKGHGFTSAPDRPVDADGVEIDNALALVNHLLNALSELAAWRLVRVTALDQVEEWLGPEAPTTTVAAPTGAVAVGRYALVRDTALDLHPFLVHQAQGTGPARPWLYDELSVDSKKLKLSLHLRLFDTNDTASATAAQLDAFEQFLGLGPLTQVFRSHGKSKELLEIEAIQKAELILSQYQEMVGTLRTKLAREVAEFVQQEESGIVLLQGEPGMGKTAFMSYLIQRQFLQFTKPPLAYFFYRRLEGMTSQTLCHQTLYAQIYEYFSKLPETPKDFGAGDTATDSYVKLSNLLYELGERQLLHNKKQLIFIDALDEADHVTGDSDMTIFRRLPMKLPKGVFLILSTRPVSDVKWFATRPGIKLLDFNDAAFVDAHHQDGQEYIDHRLRGMSVPARLAERLSQHAAGNFLFLSVICDQIAFNRFTFEDLQALLTRLESQEPGNLLPVAYEEFWKRTEGRLSDAEREAVRKVAGVLAVSLAPVNRDFINAVLGDGSERWNAAFTKLEEYLVANQEERLPVPVQPGDEVVRGNFYRLFHKSFAEFIREKVFDAREGHRLLAHFGLDWAQQPRGFRQYYAVRFGPAHLNRSGEIDDLLTLLTNPEYLVAKATSGLVADLCQDLARALVVANKKSPRREHVAVLREALLADIYFLQRHPEAVSQSLWAWAWWYDAPAAAAHYGATSAAPVASGTLATLLEQHPPEGAWIRTLRPPPVPLMGPQRMMIHGHSDGLETVAQLTTANGAMLASAGGNADRDTAIRLWDLDSGRLLKTLRGHRRLVHRVRFSPDGQRLLSSSADQTIILWDIDKGTPLHKFVGHRGNVDCIAFDPHEPYFLSAARDGSVCVWPVDASAPPHTIFQSSAQGRGVNYHPTERICAVGFTDGMIRVWNLPTPANGNTFVLHAELAVHTDVVYSVAFSPDGRWLASCSRDGLVLLWDWRERTCVATMDGHGHWVYTVAFSPDGKRLVSASRDETVRVWCTDSEHHEFGEEKQVFRGHHGAVYSVAFCPRSHGLEIISGGADGTVRIWGLSNANQRQLADHQAPIRCLSFTPDGSRLVTGAGHIQQPEHTIRVWEAQTGQLVAPEYRGHKDTVLAVAASAGAACVVSGGRDRAVRVWSAPTESIVLEHGAPVHAVAITASGDQVASGCMAGDVRVWRLTASGAVEYQHWHQHARMVSALAFHPAGTHLLSGGYDGAVWLWNLQDGTGQQVGRELGIISDVAFAADGKRYGALAHASPSANTRTNEKQPRPHLYLWKGKATQPQFVKERVDLHGVLNGFAIQVQVDTEAAEMVFTAEHVEQQVHQPVAWFPVVPDRWATHPAGGKWAVASGSHLLVLDFQGDTSGANHGPRGY